MCVRRRRAPTTLQPRRARQRGQPCRKRLPRANPTRPEPSNGLAAVVTTWRWTAGRTPVVPTRSHRPARSRRPAPSHLAISDYRIVAGHALIPSNHKRRGDTVRFGQAFAEASPQFHSDAQVTDGSGRQEEQENQDETERSGHKEEIRGTGAEDRRSKKQKGQETEVEGDRSRREMRIHRLRQTFAKLCRARHNLAQAGRELYAGLGGKSLAGWDLEVPVPALFPLLGSGDVPSPVLGQRCAPATGGRRRCVSDARWRGVL
jgi:hypothetical protein